ncbi:MAG: PEP-CTERM sorting domain-containing protein [Pirellulales bacterium]|nr:PEP-CTERM sorting domain-containing protein [Pirellulales bacterium]
MKKMNVIVLAVAIVAMTASTYAGNVYMPSPSELPAGWSLTVAPDSSGRGSITNKDWGGVSTFQFTQGNKDLTNRCWSALSSTSFDGIKVSQITALNIKLYGIEGDGSWQPPKFVFGIAKAPGNLSNRFIEWIPWSDGTPKPSPLAWQTLDALVDGSWVCPWVGGTYSTLADFVAAYPDAYFAEEANIQTVMAGFAGKSFNVGHANWINESSQYNDNNRGVVDWFEVGIDGANTTYMLNAIPEPGSLTALGIGLMGLFVLRRRHLR